MKGRRADLERELEAQAAAERHLALKLLGIDFAGDRDARSAAGEAQAADPSARPLLGRQCKRIAVAEPRGRRAQLAAEDLAPAAFELDPEPALVRTAALDDLVAEGDCSRGRSLRALAVVDR